MELKEKERGRSERKKIEKGVAEYEEKSREA